MSARKRPGNTTIWVRDATKERLVRVLAERGFAESATADEAINTALDWVEKFLPLRAGKNHKQGA